jgi:hypothetical protein
VDVAPPRGHDGGREWWRAHEIGDIRAQYRPGQRIATVPVTMFCHLQAIAETGRMA